MPQFPIPPGKRVGQMAPLSPADSKHLIRVLRARPRDKIQLFDGSSRFEAELVTLSPEGATAKLTALLVTPAIRGEVTLCQALLKKDKMGWVIQKAVELGAAQLVPFRSERTIPTGEKEAKPARWQKIADEALKQCGRVTPMRVEPVIDFAPLVSKSFPETEKILFSMGEEGAGWEKGGTVKFLLLIGPEGGFSPNEIEAARSRGFKACPLGPLVLRSETAAIAALTLVQHGLGNL